jgi:putative acyl-CoA dehydrogenase
MLRWRFLVDTVEPRTARRGRDEVFNQPPPLLDYDAFYGDVALVEAIRREGAGWAEPWLSEVGRAAGSTPAIERGVLANTYPPVLRTHDRFGHRIDEVDFHPAWHELLGQAVAWGLHASPWRDRR